MSFEPPASQFAQSPGVLFAQARSDWLNAFADLEAQIMSCANRLGAECSSPKAPLSQRLKDLGSVEASPKFSKDDMKKLKPLLESCEGLLALRATIVHARLCLGDREGSPAALFQNAFDVALSNPIYVVLTVPDFQASTSRITKLAVAYGKIGINPSSPPRPATAEAACP
jgi:hypothetical protein